MPVVSMFYGIIVSLYFFDNKQHKKPHIHARYQNQEVVMSISDAKILGGKLPQSKMKLLLAWMEIHQDELKADWALAVKGEQIFKIDPLK